MFPNQTLGKNIYIYSSLGKVYIYILLIQGGEGWLPVVQKCSAFLSPEEAAENCSPGGHLGEVRTEAEG